ncbi:hypothetical protein [Streptomyces pseudogriseolus]|uniref:hypothetical protein n=1 Tax=Streptomyces pseudogriseolus TaxID=36817 RepID=UPI003660814F
MFKRKASQAADSIASAAVRAGQKVAGGKGADVANRITGSRLERCSDQCGHCNVPCVNGTCGH